MEKYTKKATARILKEVLKVNPKASGFTSLDQAFVILMNQWDMELDVVKDGDITTCTLYRDGDKVQTWEFKDIWDSSEGDWDWNIIYRKVLEDIIRLKLYKRPKLGKRAQKKLEVERASHKPEKEEVGIDMEVKSIKKPSLEDLRKKRQHLSVRKSNYKKLGKDTSLIEKELEEVKEQIAKLTKTA